jgi:hypothetical protein
MKRGNLRNTQLGFMTSDSLLGNQPGHSRLSGYLKLREFIKSVTDYFLIRLTAYRRCFDALARRLESIEDPVHGSA